MRAAAAASAALLAITTRGDAQSIASRVAAVPDGNVHLSFAARAGLCGDGENVVRAGHGVFVLPDMGGRERERPDVVCYSGPVRVSIGRLGGQIANLRVHVGGRWVAGDAATELGVVSAPEAAAYFLSQIGSLSARNAKYAIVAATLADSASVSADLDRLARNRDLPSAIRSYAVIWQGFIGGDDTRRLLRGLVTDEAVGQEVRGSAIVALGERDIDPADAQFLETQYATLPLALHDEVFIALSRSGDPRVHRWFVDRVLDASESLATRQQALFWSGQSDMPVTQLVALRPRLEPTELRQHFTFVLSQRREEAAVDELIDMARHDANREIRKQALFWLGQSKSAKARAFLVSVIEG